MAVTYVADPIQTQQWQLSGSSADPTSGGGGGINWGQLLGSGGSLYGSYLGAQNQNNLSGAANAGFGMAQNAYNPSLFSGSGVGGTGFSVSSPSGGPGSVSSTLGAFDPMYGQYAGAAGNYLGQSQGLANTAASGATGAYQSALSSIMPQLQQMQGNLLQQNNNALFQRGQLGSGSFGQNTAGGANNPVNLTTQSLGSGFAQQDLNAIQMAQNQGLNFFNSNLAGATGLGNLGMGATSSGLGMINAQNAMGQLPLAYSQLYGGQQIGATNANANTLHAANYQGNAFGSGTGSLLQQLGGGLNGLLGGGQQGGGLGGSIQNLYNSLFGGGAGNGISSLFGPSAVSAGDIASGTGGFLSDSGVSSMLGNDAQLGSDVTSLFGPSAAGGEAATGGASLGGGAGAANMALPSTLPAGAGAAAATPGLLAPGMSALSSADIGAGATGLSDAAVGADLQATAGMPAADAAFSGGAPTLGALGGAALGAGLAGGMLGIAAHQNPTAFNQNYWNGINQTLATGPGSGTPNWGAQNALAPIAQHTQYEGAMSDLANAYANTGKGNSAIPDAEWATLAKYGITPSTLQGYNNSWAAAAANQPALSAENALYGIPNTSTPSSSKK